MYDNGDMSVDQQRAYPMNEGLNILNSAIKHFPPGQLGGGEAGAGEPPEESVNGVHGPQ